jgi:inward rectifier potassium channel
VANDPVPPNRAPGAAELFRRHKRGPIAIIRGQDKGRWLDFYHGVLTVSWGVFFLGLAGVFLGLNALFATLYLLDPGGIANARPHSFADAFFFSVETFGSIGYGVLWPRSLYANVLMTTESFFSLVNVAIATGLVFARFSRPFARVMFSNVAVITQFDGKPTLMFRAVNQRGNQIFDANVTVSYASQKTTSEGMVMRRFEEMKLVRSYSPLFALSWTVMHQIDETSPLYGATPENLVADQVEIIALLRGTDETLAETIYARTAWTPEQILPGKRFSDILSFTPHGRRVIDLARFHDTEPEPEPISAPWPFSRPR